MGEDRVTYGSGTVYQQGNSFVSQLSYTVEIDGRQYTKRITGSGKSKTIAVRNRNKNAKKWEESLKGTNVQVSTSDNYESYYEGFVRNSGLGRMPIQEITEEALLEFYMEKRKNGRKRTQKDKEGKPINVKPLSINTVNHIRFVIFNTFRYAEAKGILEKTYIWESARLKAVQPLCWIMSRRILTLTAMMVMLCSVLFQWRI